jgi:hypothetical protein
VPRRQVGLLSSTVRRPAWTHTTGWPTASPAITKRSTCRTRLAKSVHDAGWAIRLLQEKALRLGRSVVKVSRWFPSSRPCSACGFSSGSKPLEVRSWTCPQCGAAHVAMSTRPGTSWLNVERSPPGWRRPETLVEAASEADLSQRLPVKPEPAEVPRERHGRNLGHSRPPGCQSSVRVSFEDGLGHFTIVEN